MGLIGQLATGLNVELTVHRQRSRSSPRTHRWRRSTAWVLAGWS